eukprot:SAG11_NODE_34_length_22265_cov_11.264730_16_plen_171_part_00
MLRSDVDLISHISELFADFVVQIKEKTLSAASLRSMSDDDPRVMATAARFGLLTQFASTIAEFTIGPHASNQMLVLKHLTRECRLLLECCPSLLCWLKDRQVKLARGGVGSSSGLSVQRQQIRAARLRTMMEAEFHILELCDAMLEGDSSENFRLLTMCTFANAMHSLNS